MHLNAPAVTFMEREHDLMEVKVRGHAIELVAHAAALLRRRGGLALLMTSSMENGGRAWAHQTWGGASYAPAPLLHPESSTIVLYLASRINEEIEAIADCLGETGPLCVMTDGTGLVLSSENEARPAWSGEIVPFCPRGPWTLLTSPEHGPAIH